jgi:hypothetical protein
MFRRQSGNKFKPENAQHLCAPKALNSFSEYNLSSAYIATEQRLQFVKDKMVGYNQLLFKVRYFGKLLQNTHLQEQMS